MSAAMRPARLVVSLADRFYEVDRPWGELANRVGKVSDVSLDRQGRVFVLMRRDPLVDPDDDAVLELSPEGRVCAAWGGGVIADGHMLACAADGRIFVVDRDAHQVVIFGPGGEPLGALGERGRPMAPFNHPCAVAFAPGGDIFVCDGYANSRIHRFSASGEPRGCWGERGSGRGQLFSPHGIWVLSDSRVVVADRDNNRLQIFSPDGAVLDVWTGFHRPMDIWGDASDNLYVVDQVPSLSMLSRTGSLLSRCRPVLNVAHGVSGNSQTGEIFLAEPNPSRITRLRRNGEA